MSVLLPRVGTLKPTRSAARYVAGGGRERCGMCRHFQAPTACDRIQGPVSAKGWCRYFSQELVAQLYQPRGAVVGGVPAGLTLDLNFMSGTLDPSLTFTRGSTATYFDATGVMRTVSGNTPRFDNDPVTHAALGLLIEEQRTNAWIWSSFASVWGPAGSGAVAPTVTDSQTTSPDGTVDASRVVYPAVSVASNYSVLAQSLTATVNPYSFSVYLRGNVGGERLYIFATSGVTYYRTQVTLTTAWQRFVLNTPALTAAAWIFGIGTDLRDASQTATSAQTIFAWGGQVEQGAFPTSYIPTTGAAVTRSADQCSIQPAQMGFYVPPGGSWQLEFIDNYFPAGVFQRVVSQYPGPSNTCPILVGSASPIPGQFDGTLQMTGAALTLGAVTKIATTAAGTVGTACFNGGAVASGAITGGYPNLAGNGIGLLGFTGSTTERVTGYIRRVRYWPRVLSNAELQSVTR